MEIPTQAYSIIGAVSAALVAGSVSFVISILSKEQKTSEFRQSWIDAVRNDISEYLAMIGTLGTFADFKTKQGDDEALKYFNERHDDFIKLDTLATRIILRLNKREEHKKMISNIKQLKLLLKGDVLDPNYFVRIQTKVEETINESQDLFKKEWKRVKRGEPPFVITKWASLLALTTATFFFTLWAKGYVQFSTRPNPSFNSDPTSTGSSHVSRP